jgi:hypothetical protein
VRTRRKFVFDLGRETRKTERKRKYHEKQFTFVSRQKENVKNSLIFKTIKIVGEIFREKMREHFQREQEISERKESCAEEISDFPERTLWKCENLNLEFSSTASEEQFAVWWAGKTSPCAPFTEKKV